jgi:hypothetical protein
MDTMRFGVSFGDVFAQINEEFIAALMTVMAASQGNK